MSYLYIIEQGSTIGIESNRFKVSYRNGMTKFIPSDTLETIEIFGNVHMTTRCMEECLRRGVNVVFYSTKGAYYGRLVSTNHVNVSRQRQQALLNYKEDFKLEISKNIIRAKIVNQIVLIRRYNRGVESEVVYQSIKEMASMQNKCESASTVEELMGYEGNAARIYFKALGILVNEDFKFSKRSKRPPKDEFNSLISLGYSILLNEIYGKLEAKGLNPYFGIMHKDREKHPTLASDLMEEWRSVIVDSVAMSLVNGREIKKENFYRLEGEEGIFIDNEGMKIFISKMDKKYKTVTNYLTYIDYGVSFRRAMDLQVNQFVKAIESEDASYYKPILIR